MLLPSLHGLLQAIRLEACHVIKKDTLTLRNFYEHLFIEHLDDDCFSKCIPQRLKLDIVKVFSLYFKDMEIANFDQEHHGKENLLTNYSAQELPWKFWRIF